MAVPDLELTFIEPDDAGCAWRLSDALMRDMSTTVGWNTRRPRHHARGHGRHVWSHQRAIAAIDVEVADEIVLLKVT